MTTWIDTRSKPRPNVRRHPLDDYEQALTDDGKTMDEEVQASEEALVYGMVLLALVGLGLVAWWMWG